MQLMPKTKKDEGSFYKKILAILTKQDAPFLIGGTYAVKAHTGINRPTKDLDIFCKAGDYPKILKTFSEAGFNISIPDERWLAKAHYKKHFVDIIFNSLNGSFVINETWFEKAPTVKLLGYNVKVTAPEELIWSKIYRQGRGHYDGADIVHIFLKKGNDIDWKKLLTYMESHWELLFASILKYRFIYPSERNNIPKWLLEELTSRIIHQLDMPNPEDKVCRGTLLSHTQFKQAIAEWGFKDVTQFW